MNNPTLQAGYARLDITPPLGVPLHGYFTFRAASGVLDPLYATALALSDGPNRAVLMSCDLIGLPKDFVARVQALAAERAGLPPQAVTIACTHTHLGPMTRRADDLQPPVDRLYKAVLGYQDDAYLSVLARRLADACVLALQDLKPAEFSYGRGCQRGLSFIRRYSMKDGRTMTNPAAGDPDILGPVGEIDPAVSVLRVDTAGAGPVLLVHFALHADTVGGTEISADYIGFLRRFLEGAVPGSRVLFMNGTCGDINHLNPQSKDPRPQSGYAAAQRIGETLGAEAVKILQNLSPLPLGDGRLRTGSIVVQAATQSWPDETDRSLAVLEDYVAGGFTIRSMDDTARLSHCFQVLTAARQPEGADLPVSAVALGDWAMVGFPGEPFVGIGQAVKAASPFPFTLPTGLTGGDEDYFPMAQAYAQGGYEAMNSPYRPGVAEALIDGAGALLRDLAAK